MICPLCRYMCMQCKHVVSMWLTIAIYFLSLHNSQITALLTVRIRARIWGCVLYVYA